MDLSLAFLVDKPNPFNARVVMSSKLLEVPVIPVFWE